MAKTGERYTAARRQLIAKAPPGVDAPPTDAPAEVAPAAVPDSPFRGDRSASDEALVARTGQPWEHWYRVLDAWGAAARPHPDIARFLNVEQGVDGWWAQELTVRFEMAIGRRVPGQRPDGFAISASRTVGAPVERLFAAFVDEAQRGRWLSEPIRLRTATAHRTARYDWSDGIGRIAAGFTAKGEKSTVALEHSRLPDADAAEAMRAFWRDALGRLERLFAEGG
jgi:uncharacterized protein YndB with AHSA1/START domain